MKLKSGIKKRFLLPLFGLLFASIGAFTPVKLALAEPSTGQTDNAPETSESNANDTINTSENQDNTRTENNNGNNSENNNGNRGENTNQNNRDQDQNDEEETENTCYDQVEGIGWLICPTTGVLANAIDSIYGIIENFLIIDPITANEKSPIYIVWQYARDITNIVFVIMLLVVVWSQLTGVGISNYGVKKVLPRLIIVAILVNLSFILCALAVDASNILGVTLKGFFTSVEETAIKNLDIKTTGISWTNLVTALTTGTAAGGIAIGLSGGLSQFLWMLIGAVFGAVLAVFVGLVTIALRQAVVAMLIMISPLAFVAYLLPNTEKYFKKWKSTLFSMLVFYPMFSLLFGASQLAGWAIIASANSAFGVILGMTVQVLPLFLSVSLMKMSNTALGAVSGFLGGFAIRGSNSARGWANSHREMARQHYIANANTPTAGLRRYLDGRRRLREIDTKNSMDIRVSNAEKYAQGVIRGKPSYFATSGFLKDQDGNVIRDKDGNPIPIDNLGFKTNRYTRNAAKVGALAMETENAAKDTAHIIGNFGSYHGRSLQDRQLSSRVMNAYKNSVRTEITAVNDNEADVEWLVNQYLDITKGAGYKRELKGIDAAAKLAKQNAKTDAERAAIESKYARKRAEFIHSTPEYRHFITAAGGSLGERGTESVLSQVIEKAAKNETRHRKQARILASKYKYNKAEARAMCVGYYVDDNGLAIDKNTGKTLEDTPGYLLKHDPSKLNAYDLHDDDGEPYYNMTDQDGKFVTRVYRKDGPLVKELLTGFDMPINDPINGLYGILTGHEKGEFANVGLPDVGLANFSTTIGRGLLAAKFKEKAAFAGPMYSTSVMNRYIKDYVHQNMARLDNLIKTGKAGSFNVQDRAELEQLANLMNPENWEKLFPEDSLRSYRNVNGEPLKGTAVDENGNFLKDEKGNTISVDPEEATYEELFATVRKKWLNPIAPKLASMMSRYTQGTADNQKPGTDDKWTALYDALQNYNNPELQKKYHLGDPFAAQTGFYDISREIKNQIHPRHKKGKDTSRSAYSTDNPASSETILNDHTTPDIDPNPFSELDNLREEYSYDAEKFAENILNFLEDYIKEHPNYANIYDAVSSYIHDAPYDDVEELYNEIHDIFDSYFSD